jgi:hypothetical protein
MPDYNDVLKTSDLTIKLKPQNYFSVNRTNSITYEEQRILVALNDTSVTNEAREQNIKEITDKLIELNVENLASSTDYILMIDGTKVTDYDFIKEFYANTSSSLIRSLRDKLTAIAEDSGIKPYMNTCSECGNEFKTDVTFDYANFFGNGS